MDAIIIKTKGSLLNPKMIVGGVAIFNPSGSPITGQNNGFYIANRVLDDNTEETVGNVVERVYSTKLNIEITTYTVDGISKKLYGRGLASSFSNGFDRIDILDEDVDSYLTGSSVSGYSNPCRIYAEQIHYSNISKNGRVVRFKNVIGTVDLAWFADNEDMLVFEISGDALCTGSIMNLAKSWRGLSQIYLNGSPGVYGVMSALLNAFKASGTVSKTVYFNIDGSSVTNDVSTSKTFTVTFDANGNWTVTNPIS